ncbi:MAG TPA: NAD-dependent epimerase/dehydratase family protein [Caldimonas sp.]|nr:NAD-dependent epimerase/dehydratase family protein [Caldimonas sp.]HEX2542295.1 NAD-dependent epimerase/dehydratase family protein [Caldimonas sp.]
MILVTGGHGFLGRCIVRQLGDTPHLAPRSAELDLLDGGAVARYLDCHGVTKIVHAAGFVGGIGLHRRHPGRVAAENLVMGVNLLRAAAALPVPAHVVIVSTVCAYPEAAPIPTPEAALYDGYPSPDTAAYGLAKRELHSLAGALAEEFGLSYSYVIPTNLYGPEDHFDEARSHVVPALIRRAHEARSRGDASLVVWGDGSATRDLLYVDDCARGLLLALERPEARGEVINLGSGEEVSIRVLAETVCRVVGFEGRLEWDASKPQGAPRRALDPAKARRLLDFTPRVSLEDGLRRAADWYMTRA